MYPLLLWNPPIHFKCYLLIRRSRQGRYKPRSGLHSSWAVRFTKIEDALHSISSNVMNCSWRAVQFIMRRVHTWGSWHGRAPWETTKEGTSKLDTTPTPSTRTPCRHQCHPYSLAASFEDFSYFSFQVGVEEFRRSWVGFQRKFDTWLVETTIVSKKVAYHQYH